MRISRNLSLIYGAAFLRSASIGMLGVVLAVYLSRTGFSATAIGFVLASGLVGSAVATGLTGRYGERIGRKRLLIASAILSSAGGIGLAFVHTPTTLVPLAFLMMLNGMGTDRSAAFAVEQAVIPSLVSDRIRTWALSWYNVVLDTSGAVGALGGALPVLIQRWMNFDLLHAYKSVFFLYTGLNLVSAAVYFFLDSQIEAPQAKTMLGMAPAISETSKRTVRKIAALFALDAGGGGFLADALLAYWFFQRFGVTEAKLGLLFFIVRILNGVSHLGAAWLAGKIGLVRTMVFTHLPSSLFLLIVPFAPTFKLAAILLLCREALVEMDVPTRQSYVAAVVQPHERVYASGITNLTRTGGWAVTASLSGVLMQNVAFSAPLILGGSMKVIYDILLYTSFRHLRPPEESKPDANK
jgi:MFS family permease